MLFIKLLKNKNKKIYYWYFTILLVWILFFYFNLITQYRLIWFFLILIFILLYKFFIKLVEKIEINSQYILDLLIFFNRYRNPIYLFLIYIENYLLDKTLIENKILNIFIFLNFLIFLNPIKIFFYKFYKILLMWKDTKFFNLLFGRMFGLILSILIFTDIINFLKNALYLNIFGLIFIYLLVASFLMEIINTFLKSITEDKWFKVFSKIFLVPEISTKSIFSLRQSINLVSIMILNNNLKDLNLIFENILKINYKIIFNFSYMSLGNTFFCINSYKYLIGKPNYILYIYIYFFLGSFNMSMSDYIFSLYHDFNFSNYFVDSINKAKIDLLNYKLLMDFKFKIFRLVFFLYLDFLLYLDLDIKKSVILDQNTDIFFLDLNLMLDEKSYMQLLINNNKIFWEEDFMLLIFNVLNKFNLIDNFEVCNFETMRYIEFLNYKKLDIFSSEVDNLKKYLDLLIPDAEVYYNKFLDKLYEEYFDLKIEKKIYYLNSINELNYTYDILLKNKNENLV